MGLGNWKVCFMERVNWRPTAQCRPTPTSDAMFCCFYSADILPCLPGPPCDHLQRAFAMEVTPDDIEVPRNDKAAAADHRISQVEVLLRSLTRPEGLDEAKFRQFVRYSSDFFIGDDKLWRRDPTGRHKIVIPAPRRLAIMKETHDALGHKKIYAVRIALLERFWWPYLDHDVKWFVQSCHQCQVRQMRYHHIPPTVAAPASLFRKAYLDTMFMPRVAGYRYIVQARCSLSAYPEHRKLRRETGALLGAFIFEDILCRWGALEEIVTDNGKPFIEAVDWLAQQYGIRHIRISPYNSQANGIVERRHLDVREAIMKVCDGDERKWPASTHAVFWAERITTHRALGHSSYYIVHGVEPLLPFDITEATYLVPPQSGMTSTDLLALRARQLQKRPTDLADIHARVMKARFSSVRQFEKKYANSIKTYEFSVGDMVLIRNSRVEMSLDRKAKPRWIGPMVVVRRTEGGSYILAELDGTVSKLRFAGFRVVPYHARKTLQIDPDTFFHYAEDDTSSDTTPDPLEDDEVTTEGIDAEAE